MTITNEQEKKSTSFIPTRDQLIDEKGRYLTQSLFLEIGYSPEAIYTMKEVDHEYKGKEYPSIKRLFLEMEDVTEYEFANKYFAGWNHWKRICANKALASHIDEWRYELELKLRARSVKEMKDLASQGSYQASKWLADKGWAEKVAGRPTKEAVEREIKVQADIKSEYDSDVSRLSNLIKMKG